MLRRRCWSWTRLKQRFLWLFPLVRTSVGLIFRIACFATYVCGMPRPWCAVTNNFQFDGFGSQYLSIMSAIAFARCQNLTFCYTPLRTMDHNGEGRREYLREVQDIMNVGEPAFSVGGASHLQSSTHEVFGPSGTEPTGHMGTGQWLSSHVEQPCAGNALRHLRELFEANTPKRRSANANRHGWDVAVHVRRWTAEDNAARGMAKVHPYTYWQDGSYLQAMGWLSATLGANVTFHIYSQGLAKQFAAYRARFPTARLHLNEPLNRTFPQMVHASGLLLTGDSSLSRAAALLREGPTWVPEGLFAARPSQWRTFPCPAAEPKCTAKRREGGVLKPPRVVRRCSAGGNASTASSALVVNALKGLIRCHAATARAAVRCCRERDEPCFHCCSAGAQAARSEARQCRSVCKEGIPVRSCGMADSGFDPASPAAAAEWPILKGTLKQAAAECAAHNARLCTPQELISTCCGTGCGLDNAYVWSNTGGCDVMGVEPGPAQILGGANCNTRAHTPIMCSRHG